MSDSHKSQPAPTFRQRVESFWDWYRQRADEFYQTIEAGDCGELVPEVSEQLESLLPGFAWVFGPGESDEGHSFTLSPEGDPHLRLLTGWWKEQAPALPGWTFHASRQPSEDLSGGWGIQIAEQSYKAEELWVTLSPDDDGHLIDLFIWHPAFAENNEHAHQIVFIMLDEALGEDVVGRQLGRIEVSSERLEESMPLPEIVDEIARIRKGWELEGDGEYVVYQLTEPDDRFPRSDTLTGTTCHNRILEEFFGQEGQAEEDPLEGTGASFVFLAFGSDQLRDGDQAGHRGEIEDAIEERFAQRGVGKVLGGALGLSRAYIDLLFFDGEVSTAVLREALVPFGLTEVQLYPFIGDSRKALISF